MATVVSTKVPRPKKRSTKAERTPKAASRAATRAPAERGLRKLRRRLSAVARRQEMRGPTPMKNIRPSKMGPRTALKNGAPTETFLPVTASAKMGKVVPRNTVKAATTSRRLLNRKLVSRERKLSILASLLMAEPRWRTSP